MIWSLAGTLLLLAAELHPFDRRPIYPTSRDPEVRFDHVELWIGHHVWAKCTL